MPTFFMSLNDIDRNIDYAITQDRAIIILNSPIRSPPAITISGGASSGARRKKDVQAKRRKNESESESESEADNQSHCPGTPVSSPSTYYM